MLLYSWPIGEASSGPTYKSVAFLFPIEYRGRYRENPRYYEIRFMLLPECAVPPLFKAYSCAGIAVDNGKEENQLNATITIY